MNQIVINKLSDLNEAENASIYVSENKSLVKAEIDHNEWALTFSENLIQKITLSDLRQFLSQLIQQRANQLAQSHITSPVTFYLWFDEQALHLCFNLISGDGMSLPFGCKLNILLSPIPILENFLSVASEIAREGQDITFINPGDEGWDEDDDDDNDNFILDVYREVINPIVS
jgi:hypothetical protein